MKFKLTRTHARPGFHFALARFGGRTVVAGSDGVLTIADLDAEKPTFDAIGTHGGYVTGLAVAGTAVVSSGYDGRLVWWDIDAKKQVRAVEAHAKWGRGVAATPDGSRVVSIADDMIAKVWDAATGQLVHELSGHAATTPHDFPSMLHAVAVSPDGALAATGDKVGRVCVWDLATGKQRATLDGSAMYTWDPTARRHSIGGVRSLAFSADGKALLAGGVGKINNIDHLDGKPRVEVFEWSNGKRTHEIVLDQMKGLVESLVVLPSDVFVIAFGGANDGFLAVLDVPDWKVAQQEKVPAHAYAATRTEAGDRLFVAAFGKLFAYAAE